MKLGLLLLLALSTHEAGGEGLDPSKIDRVSRFKSDEGAVLGLISEHGSKYYLAAGGHVFDYSTGSSFAIGLQTFQDAKFGGSCIDPGWDAKEITFYCGGCKVGPKEKPELQSTTRVVHFSLEPGGKGRVSDGRYVGQKYEWAHYGARDGQEDTFVLKSAEARERLLASTDYRPGVRIMTEAEYTAEYNRLNHGEVVTSTLRQVQSWPVVRSRETQATGTGEIRDWFEVPKSIVARYSNVKSSLASVEYVVTWNWGTRKMKVFRIIRTTDAPPVISEVPFREGMMARGDVKANTIAIDDPAYLGKGAEVRVPTVDQAGKMTTTLHYPRKFPHLRGGELPDHRELLKDPARAGELRSLIHSVDPDIRFKEELGQTAASICESVLTGAGGAPTRLDPGSTSKGQ